MARKKGVPKMGRPAGPPENVRRNRVVVFVTDAELAKLHRMTEDSGRPLGTVAYELLGRALRGRR
jgi:hypothetical protein